ncbi:hypothetical protein AVEN_33530-1 [Araneus ventricosus]|uniref:Secreted protein n=1 Tax=Araneus ventricosus TaxID=182803 RepID=A0A4Y2L5N9_ARAVE|nr:hypothetical protein AVEN_33530-1 [Araneus ventricosus]
MTKVLHCVVFASIILSTSHHSLIIVTSRFEATRGLYWDGPRNFEPRSDDDSWADTYTLLHRTTPTGGRLPPTHDFACNRHNKRRIFSGIACRTHGPQSRDLTTKPSRPFHKSSETNFKKYIFARLFICPMSYG